MRHEALIHSSDEELVEGTRELIEGGLVAGDLVIVFGGDHQIEPLREAWGDDPRITFTDQKDAYRSPTYALAEFQRMMQREQERGQRIRVTAPVPFGEEPRSRRTWTAYEALIDRALAPYDFTSLCQYDTRVLTDELIDHGRATHDRVITSSGVETGGDRREEVLAEVARLDAADPLATAPRVYEDMVTGPRDLARVRAGLRDVPQDLLVGASEVITNALVHGGPPVIVTLHRAADGWLLVVTDHGPGLRDPYAGVDSPLADLAEASGRGLWIARQLCDQLTITCDPEAGGTTVRLMHWS